MTAVLSAVDIFRKENMDPLDDNHASSSCFSQTDWKAKYYEAADMLTETRNELDDFHTSSKELEEELERELQRTETAHQDLKVKLEKAECERDEWKTKFISLQTNHNTTTASLQRELDQLRADHQKMKIQLRELEMGNDDLERSERAVSSNLADVEAKYARVLEEKILLEHELLDKAHIEEESQRLKDDLRDANAEISILRDQLLVTHDRPSSVSQHSTSSEPSPPTPASSLHHSEEDLLQTKPPSDLQHPDDASKSEEFSSIQGPAPETPRAVLAGSDSYQSMLPKKPGIGLPRPRAISPETPRSVSRPTGLPLPKYSSPSTPSRVLRTNVARPQPRIPIATASSVATSVGNTTITARSRGVQMVSEMRARVKTLEQKIHTHVPRIRLGSMSRPNPIQSATVTSSISRPSNLVPATTLKQSHVSSTTAENLRTPVFSRHSTEDKRSGDTGWVLVMEDSPSPVKKRTGLESRRLSLDSSPSRSGPSRNHRSAAASPPLVNSSLARSVTLQSGLKRPQSRLSDGHSSIGTITTTSSIPTPSSRPTSPSFLPLPSTGTYTSINGTKKRSTGPSNGLYSGNSKRSSLGASTALSDNMMSDSGLPSGERFTPVTSSRFGVSRIASGSPSSFRDSPSFRNVSHSSVTVRSKLPSPSPQSSQSQSKIGRPAHPASR